jgi:hypothetical protein
MRQSLWSVALAGLGFGSLSMVGGTALGGEVAPLAVGYGLLVVLAALYLIAGLAIRERVWHRIGRSTAPTPTVDRLAGRRVF